MKKLISFVMAVAMVATMSVTVFATDPWDGSFGATGAVALPVIDVTCSGTTGAKLFVNPYQFELKTADGAALTLEEDAVTGTNRVATRNTAVFSPTYVLTNNTPLKLDVYVNGTATPKGGVSIAKADVAADSTKKEVCVYAHFGAVTLDANNAVTAFTAGTDATSKFMLGTAEAKEAQKVITLDKSATGALKSVGFEFDGSAAKEPKEAWVAADGVDVALVITFKPAATS